MTTVTAGRSGTPVESETNTQDQDNETEKLMNSLENIEMETQTNTSINEEHGDHEDKGEHEEQMAQQDQDYHRTTFVKQCVYYFIIIIPCLLG